MDTKNKTQEDDVAPDEKVLRRLLKHPKYYDPGLSIPVQRLAFYPTEEDTDGLSLFRELFTSAENVAGSGTNPKGYAVAQLIVGAINELNLTVIPNPRTDTLPGHSLIPEINYIYKNTSKQNKQRIKDLSLELAKIASKKIILE